MNLPHRLARWTVIACLTVCYTFTATASTLLLQLEIRGLDRLARSANFISESFDVPVEQEMLVFGLLMPLGVMDDSGLDLNAPMRMAAFTKTGNFNDQPDLQFALGKDAGAGDAFLQSLKSVWPLDEEWDGPGVRLTRPVDFPVQAPFPALYVDDAESVIRLATDPTALAALPDTGLDSVEGAIALMIYPDQWIDFIGSALEMSLSGLPTEDGALEAQKLDEWSRILLDVFRTMRATGLGWEADAKHIHINSYLSANPDNLLAELISSMKRPSDQFLALLPEESVYASVSYWDFPDALYDFYLEFMTSFLSMVPDQEDALEIIKLAVEMMRSQYAGDIAIGILPSRDADGESMPIDIIQAMRVRDPDALRTQMIDYVYQVERLMGTAADDTAVVRPHLPRVYRDIEIHGYAMDSTAGIDDADAQAMAAMMLPFLSDVSSSYAFVGDIALTVTGSEQVMDRMIDRILDGGTPLTQAQPILSAWPDLGDAFVELSLLKAAEFLHMAQDALPFLPLSWVSELSPHDGAFVSKSWVDGHEMYGLTLIDLPGLTKAIQAATAGEAPATDY